MILLTKNNHIMKKIYFVLAMLMLSVSSAWADGYTCILFGNSTGVEGLTTDNYELTGALNFDNTLSDGTAMNLKGTAGKFWSNPVNNTTWENTVAIEEINTALLPADAEIKFSADYFKSGGWQFVATGAGGSTSTLKLTLTPYNEGDKIVLYAAISNPVSAVSNFSASGLDNMSMSYATNTGDGFSTTKSFSSATKDITIVKIQGELQSSKVVSLTSSNQKNGWQMVSYIVTPGDPKKTISYTLTDALGTQYNGTYDAVWNDDDTPLPKFDSAKGCTLENAVFADEGGNYTLSANIVFPFPISNETEKNPTAIQSALGESKWYANADGKLKANNKANTNPLYSNQDNWNWYIYPEFNDGVFTFKLYNVGAGKYIPTITAQNQNTATELSDEAGSFQFAEVRTDQYGFYLPSANKFLTINTNGTNQNIWLWTAGGGHMGSTMSFPEAIVVTLEDLQAQLAPLANTEKFELIEGATVISPSEYAAPSEINAAIDAAKAVDNTDPVAIETFLTSVNASKIKTFQEKSALHGAPLSVSYSAKAGYNTIILPINWSVPSNWTKYSCEAVDGNVLTLTAAAVTGDSKNTPYIVLADKDETFQFIGYSNGADTENVKTAGILAGANFATTAPAGSYILTNGSDRFEKVYEDTEVTANQCWIVLESNAAALLFEAQPTPAKATANMRITDAGWGTFYATFAVAIPEGVKAYTGTLITESETPWIRMDELTEGVIPANTGVVVAKKVEGEAYSEDLEEIETAVATASTCYTGNADNYNVVVEEGAYLLQKNYAAEKQENVVGWYKVQGKGFTLAPNRCYLAKGTLPEAAQTRSFIGFEPVDDATGINSIATEAKTKADGKYMVNGQIVVVKAGKAYYMNGTEVK